MLAPDQQQAYEAVMRGENVLITGAGGTGKSFLIDKLSTDLMDSGRKTVLTASTGIAAVNIDGRTIHRYLGIGISKDREDARQWLERMPRGIYHALANRFGFLDALVVDEVSMLSGDFLDAVSAWLRHFTIKDRPWGGKQVIFVGDFMQLPPVFRRDEDPPKRPYAFLSAAWRNSKIQVYELTTAHRQEDAELVSALNRIRFGELTDADRVLFDACVGRELDEPTELYATNADVDHVNARKLDELDGELIHLPAQIELSPGLRPDRAEKILSEFRRSLTPLDLYLKPGAPVLMTRNDPGDLYVNGTRARIVDFEKPSESLHEFEREEEPKRGLIVEIDGVEHPIAPVDWHVRDGNGEIEGSMFQYPVRLAWALTIHKAQGMTLDPYRVDLEKCFAPGQAYVALSRTKRLEGLSLAAPLDPKLIFVHPVLKRYYEWVRKRKDAA